MARPLRIKFAGALYHITARGNARQDIYLLGSDKFVEAMQAKIDPQQSLKDIPKPQKIRPVKPISFYKEKYKSRNKAIAEAYRSGHYTLPKVGDEFGVSYATVSRAVKDYECKI